MKIYLLLMQKEVDARIEGGVGTILEKNQFDQTLNALALRKLMVKNCCNLQI